MMSSDQYRPLTLFHNSLDQRCIEVAVFKCAQKRKGKKNKKIELEGGESYNVQTSIKLQLIQSTYSILESKF